MTPKDPLPELLTMIPSLLTLADGVLHLYEDDRVGSLTWENDHEEAMAILRKALDTVKRAAKPVIESGACSARIVRPFVGTVRLVHDQAPSDPPPPAGPATCSGNPWRAYA